VEVISDIAILIQANAAERAIRSRVSAGLPRTRRAQRQGAGGERPRPDTGQARQKLRQAALCVKLPTETSTDLRAAGKFRIGRFDVIAL